MNPKRTMLTRTLAAALCAVMLLTLCACHGRRGQDESNERDNSDEAVSTSVPETSGDDGQETEYIPIEKESFNEETVAPDDVVDTFNIALVIDTSASLEASDPYGLALRSAVTFLESMYAGNANQERLLGAKHANVNIITYNDTVNPLFGQLYSLDDGGTVDELVKHVYGIERGRGGDSALGDALETAVNMFSDLTQSGRPGAIGFPPPPPPPGAMPQGMMPPPGGMGPPPMPFGGREQNLIILFTDGYSQSGVSQTAFEEVPAAPPTPRQPSARMLSSSDPQTPPPFGQQEREMPYFGGRTQVPLERALKAAQQRQCEIIVLGLHTSSNTVGGFDAYWSEFKKIANYTQLQMGPPGPPPDMNGMNPMGEQGGMPFMPPPPPPVTGRVGGGMFESTDSDFPVNYKEAKTLMEAQRIYIQIASSMLQGTGTQTPKTFMEGDVNRYECDVKGQVAAAVFYVLSSDPEGVNADNLIDPSGNSWFRKLNDGENAQRNYWSADGKARAKWYAGCLVVTVLNPEPGVWTLRAHPSGGDRSEFAVHMTQIGGVELEISFKQDERFADDGKIFVRAKYQGAYMTKEFYDNATATCEVMPPPPGGPPPMAPNGDAIMPTGSQDNGALPPPPGGPGGPQRLALTYDAESSAMTTVYRAPAPGSYNVNVMLHASDVDYLVSGSVNFKPRGEEQYIRRKSIKLTPQLTDSWKDIPLTIVSWDAPRNLLTVEQNKRDAGTLILEGVESGTGTLSVTVTGEVNGMQQTWIIEYPVTVEK